MNRTEFIELARKLISVNVLFGMNRPAAEKILHRHKVMLPKTCL